MFLKVIDIFYDNTFIYYINRLFLVYGEYSKASKNRSKI